MVEVDTRLEEAMEAVLVRYRIPPLGLSAAIGLWDRGDLASDLADAARSLLALDVAVVVHLGVMDGSLQCCDCGDIIRMLTDGEMARAVVDHECRSSTSG